jgi:hypothetical protein
MVKVGKREEKEVRGRDEEREKQLEGRIEY